MHELDSTEAFTEFTFITEKEGSTIIEQLPGSNIDDAFLRWLKVSQVRPGDPAEGDWPTPIKGVKSVWCMAGHDPAGVFYLTHIVATLTA